MALLLLSPEIVDREFMLGQLVIISHRINAKCNLDSDDDPYKTLDDKRITLIIEKKYKKTKEYLMLYLNYKEENFETDSLKFVIADHTYCRIGVTEDAKQDHIIYDFAKEYFSFFPNHYLSLWGKNFFNIDDMQEIERRGGYYKDWCYKYPSIT